MKTKICTKCKVEKPLSEYHRRNDRKLREQCKSCRSEYMREYAKRSKDVRARYVLLNKEAIKERDRKYKKEHKEERNALRKKRRSTDLQFKIKTDLKGKLYHVLKNKSNKSSIFKLLGCDIGLLIKHFESLFKEGMTWHNHSRKGWHIDHIIPCCAFDLTKIEDQRKCFHYTNLQPLWAWENMTKGVKFDSCNKI